MNLKQLFCSHIWKQLKIEVIDSAIGFVAGFPTSHTEYRAITYECMKCKKTKIVSQEYKRFLTLEETKLLIK